MFVKKSMEELGRKSAQEARSFSNLPVILILDDVRSMHNVGSIFRTADAFGVEAVFLTGYTPQPPHREIHKTALGATETVEWKHFSTIEKAVQLVREKEYLLLATEQTTGSTPLHCMRWSKEPVAIVFGNEVTGVSEAALQSVDAVIEIPQFGAKHSLNIGVSVGVVLWELTSRLLK